MQNAGTVAGGERVGELGNKEKGIEKYARVVAKQAQECEAQRREYSQSYSQ